MESNRKIPCGFSDHPSPRFVMVLHSPPAARSFGSRGGDQMMKLMALNNARETKVRATRATAATATTFARTMGGGGCSSSEEHSSVSYEEDSDVESDAGSVQLDPMTLEDDRRTLDKLYDKDGPERRKLDILARLVGVSGAAGPAAVLAEVVRTVKALEGGAAAAQGKRKNRS